MSKPHKSPAAVSLGRKGGKAGTGAKKRRDQLDPDYYRKLAEKSHLAHLRKTPR